MEKMGKKSSGRNNLFFFISSLVLVILSIISIVSISCINKKSTPVAPFGSLNAVVRGAGANSYINCDASIDMQRRQIWDCKAGLTYVGDSERMQQIFDEQGNSRVDFIFYAMDSNVEIYKKEDGGSWSIAKTSSKYGVFTPGFGERVKEHTYKSVLVSVEDIKKCSGIVIYKESESSGIPVPNNCFVDFRLVMPETSVGVGNNQLSFITPMVTTASAQAKGQESSPGGDVEYILNDMGVISKNEMNPFFPLRGSFSEMKLAVADIPSGWIPASVSPEPGEESQGFSYPEWSVLGNSKKVFQVAASGSVPPTIFSDLSLIISTILGGLISTWMAIFIEWLRRKRGKS